MTDSNHYLLCDLVASVGGEPWSEFRALCPHPALLLLPDGPPPTGEVWQRLEQVAARAAGLALTFLPLEEGRRGLVLGLDGDVRVAGDGVSGRHAEVRLRSATCWVRDLESASGTRIEGQPLAVGVTRSLPPGAVLTLGRTQALLLTPRLLHRLLTLIQGAVTAPIQLPPRGLLLSRLVEGLGASAGVLPPHGAYLVQLPLASPTDSPASTHSLTRSLAESCILGAERSRILDHARVFSLPADRDLSIGRGGDCDLVLDEPSASRHHARLRYAAETLHVVDLASQNGTFAGDHRIPAGVRTPLPVGETVRFGRCLLMVLGPRELQDLLALLQRRLADRA